jgi:hypothetical protein
MRFRVRELGIGICSLLMLVSMAVAPALAGDKKAEKKAEAKQTLSGVVSDSMCGAKHMMEGSPAECTRACVGKGSKYALVVGDKVYTLDSSDQKTLDQLNKLAGEKAKVTGTVNGDTVEVSSVSAG